MYRCSAFLRKWALILLIVFADHSVVLAASSAKDWKVVRIGIDAYNAPFSSVDSALIPNGFDIDIAKALCSRMSVTCEFVPASREALLPNLLLRRIDAVLSAAAVTDDQRNTLSFSNKYYSLEGRFVVNRTSDSVDTSPEALRGKVVGAVAGTPYASYVSNVYGSKGIAVKLYKSEPDAFTDLRDGRLSLLLGGSVPLYHWFKEGNASRCCRFLGQSIRNTKYLGDGAGIAVRKEDADLATLFNKAIEDILRDGTYEKINAVYFDFFVY